MTSKVSQEEYQNLMKLLQSRKTSGTNPAVKDTLNGSSGRRDTDLTRHVVDHVARKNKLGLLEEDDDSDSGYTNSISQPPSTSNLLSSGTSVDSATYQKTAPLGSAKSVMSGALRESERDAVVTMESSILSKDSTHIENQDSPLKEEMIDLSSRQFEPDEGNFLQPTPSKLLQKRTDRECGIAAGGVGSFQSFTSPSVLIGLDSSDSGSYLLPVDCQPGSAKEDTGQSVGVGSFESFTAPSQLLLMAQEEEEVDDDKTTDSPLPLHDAHVEKPDQRKSQNDNDKVSDPSAAPKEEFPQKLPSDVQFETASSEDKGSALTNSKTASLDLGSTDRQKFDPGSTLSVDSTFFQYSTPSNLLLRREQRLKAEDVGGVDSFQSFTTPSELFMRKNPVGSYPSSFKQIDLDREQPDTHLCKSSMDQFLLDSCPSELLKLKTELAINERIASTKSLHQPQGKTQKIEKNSKEVLQPSSLKSDVSDDKELVMEDIEVKLSVEGTASEEEQHVTFGENEKSAEESETQGPPTSSGSDISLIMEEISENIGQECPDQEENFSSSMGQPARQSSHLVAKAKSYPLIHLQHATLCYCDDTIQCECTDRESVEKLVGHDFVERKKKRSVEMLESPPSEKSHSWADDTWRSLELVVEKHQDMQKEEDSWEPKATANLSYSSRSDADAKYIQEENEKLKQAIAEKDWILMEAKLEHSRQLVQNRKEMTQEKAQLVQKYHRVVDELTEQRDAAEFKLKKQAEEIHFLEEEAWANHLNYTTQLSSLKEENLRLTEVHRCQLQEIETLKDQLHGLVVEVDCVKAEETRLKKLLSDTGEELSQEICTGEQDKEMKTAHAKIFVELDENQNKFTIDTEVDRAFICGDGTKSGEELHKITDALTKFVRDELLLNVIPLLYPSSSSEVNCVSDADRRHDDPSLARSSLPKEGGFSAPGASVTITLGNQEDTTVKIQAEMDAGFLGEGKKDEEVEIVTQKIAKYVQDHFLEGMLERLFPGRDVKSMFTMSSDVFSSSLHSLNVPSSAVMEHPRQEERQATETIDKGSLLAIEALNVTSSKDTARHQECQTVGINQEELQSPVTEKLTSDLAKAQAEVTALQSIIRKQELEKSQLSEKYERRGEQLKDICSQFTENERQWTDEKDVMKKRLTEAGEEIDDMKRNLDVMKIDGSQKEQEIRSLKELVSESQSQLQESTVKIEQEIKTRETAQREVDALELGIRKSQDEKELLLRKLEEKEKALESLSSNSESQRASLEAHLSHYKEVLKDKELKLKTLKESKEQVEGIRLLENKLSTLKMENSHLKTSLEALTPPYDLPTSPRTDGNWTFADRPKTTGIVSVPWNKYHFLLANNQQLASRVNELEKEKEDHMKRGRLLDEELRRFQGEMGSLKSSIAQLTGDLRDALLESKNLEHKIETGELRAEFKLQTQLRDTQEMRDEKQKELMRKLTSAEDDRKKLRGERDGWIKELKKLGEEKSKLEARLSKNTEELRSCQEDLKKTKELLNVKQAQLSTASSLLEEMRYEKGGMSSKILDLYQELLKTQADVERAKDSSKEDIVQLQCRVSSLEKSLLCHEKDLSRAESELKQARSDLEDAESSKVTKDHAFQQLQMEKDEALEEVTALQQKLQERELKMLVINEAHQKNEEEMERITSKLSSLMSEAELSRRELDKKDKEVKDKAQRVESLEAELQSKTEEVLEERGRRDGLEWQLKEETQEHTKLQEQFKTLEDENASLNQELRSIQLEKEREQNAYGLLQQQYQTLHDNNTRLDCKSETDREFNRFLQVELEKSKDEVEKLKDKTRGLRSEVEHSKRTIEKTGEDLDRSISESQSEISRLESLLDKAFESQETLEKSNKDQAEALEAEMQKVEALTEDLEQLQKEFVEERKMVKKLQEEKDSLRSRLDSKIEKLSNEKNNLQERLYQAEVNAKVDQCRQEAQSRQMSELKSYFERQMSDNGAASQRVDALMKEIQTLQEKNSGLNRTIDSMEDKCDTLMKEVEEKKRGMADLSARLSLAEHQSRSYQQRIEELEVEIQKEKNLAESVKNVSKEKKKRWLLSNQLFSSKIKAQLESSDEKIRELQDELTRVSHQNQLQVSEISEKSHAIESLQERAISLEEAETSLMEELQKTKRQLGKERDLVQSLSERLLKTPDLEKSNFVKRDSSFGNRTHPGKPVIDVEADEKMMKSDMKALEAEMKKNLKEEIQDHVKNVTKQFITPRKSDFIEDIAAGISEMRQQHHQEREKIDNLSANLDALNSTLLERLTPMHHSTTLAPPNPKRRLSSVAEMNHAIRRANLRATGRRNGMPVTFDPPTNPTGNSLQPQESLLNNSTVLAGSSDLFYIPESS